MLIRIRKYLFIIQALLTIGGVLLLACQGIAQLTSSTLQVQYDSAWTYKNLQLIPVRFKPESSSTHAAALAFKNGHTLAEALSRGKAKIKEVIYENGADVNWLSIENDTRQPIFVNSGDLLAGGKQDRMIAETKIIEPGKSDYVKVYCIEKGRWDDKIKSFNHSGSGDIEIKKVMDVTNRQADVWKEIERQFAVQNKATTTWPYLTLRSNTLLTDSGYYQFFFQKFKQSDSAFAGFLAITGNRLLSCELYASAGLATLAFPSILSSWVQTALIGKPPVVPLQKMSGFMYPLLESEASQKKYLALHGQIHYYKDRVLHVVAYGD